MKYEDWEDANYRIGKGRDRVSAMTPEELAAVDIAQQILHRKFTIDQYQQDLKRLERAAKKLPKPTEDDMKISSTLILEGAYKFRNKRELEHKLYGWPGKYRDDD